MRELSCSWETCNNEPELFRFGYCSEECKSKSAVLAFHRFDCRFEDEEPPTPEEIDQRFGACPRWTPDAMQNRIDELKREVDRIQSPSVEWEGVDTC